MADPVDCSRFPVGEDIDYDSPEERKGLEQLRDDARGFIESRPWSPPIAELLLAFGVSPILALFLVRHTEPIAQGERAGDLESWVVVGDLPFMLFEPDEARTPARALELYCAIAQDWADRVLANDDLSESYPIPVAPTEEHAEMLLRRIDFIRKELIPLAQ